MKKVMMNYIDKIQDTMFFISFYFKNRASISNEALVQFYEESYECTLRSMYQRKWALLSTPECLNSDSEQFGCDSKKVHGVERIQFCSNAGNPENLSPF